MVHIGHPRTISTQVAWTGAQIGTLPPGMPTDPKSSFVIATRSRPDDLLRTVESLVAQTVLPDELAIVDSSDATPTREAIEKLCADNGLSLDYFHPAPRGLTVQRNVGIDRTTGDIVFFVDDDVRLEPDCHEQILAEYGRWGSGVGRGSRRRPGDPGPSRKTVEDHDPLSPLLRDRWLVAGGFREDPKGLLCRGGLRFGGGAADRVHERLVHVLQTRGLRHRSLR